MSDLDSSESVNLKGAADEDASSGSSSDPWTRMDREDAEKTEAEREKELQKRKNEMLGIGGDDIEWDDRGLVVPVKDLVNFAGNGRDIKERRQAAFGFAHFSTEESTQKQIVEFQNDYGIDANINLLKSDDPVCRRYGALTLGNLTSNRELAGRLIDYGVLEAMLPVAVDENEDLETRRYCMLGVANVAADQDTHKSILQNLDPIMLLIDSMDEEIQKCAALCLQNLSANRDIILQLEDGIQPLVNLLSIVKGKRVPLPDAKLHAVAALRGMAVSDVLRLRIINEGVLRAFVGLVDEPPSDHILVEIAAILCGFSTLYETHVDLLQKPVMATIFILAMGDIVEAQRYATTCLANLTSNTANHQQLLDANALQNILAISNYHDPRVKAAAARALANFVGDAKRHQLVLDEGGFDLMIRILNEADSACNLFASLFFSILCDNESLHVILSVPELIQPLFHVAVMPDNAIEVKRYAILSLANLALSPQSHPFILSEIEIQMNSFFKLTSSSDEETQEYLALLLSNLAENVNSHDLLSSPLALEKCVALFDRRALPVTTNALSFILKLLIQDGVRVRVAPLFTPSLIDAAQRWYQEEILFMVAAFFSNVSTSQEVRESLDWPNVMAMLGRLLECIHHDIQLQTLNAIANARDIEIAIKHIVESQILQLVLNALHSPSIEIHACALRLLTGVCAHEYAISFLKKLKVTNVIGPFVRSPHSAFRKYAFVALANYTSHTTALIDLNDINLIKCYLNVAIDERSDVEEMRCCLFALANTVFHEENAPVVRNSGILILKTLLDYVSVEDTKIWEYSALLLANCSVKLGNHHMFGYRDVIEMIFLLAANGEGSTVLHAYRCLRNLAHHRIHVDLMLECGLIQHIIHFCKMRAQRTFNEFSIQIDKEVASLTYNLAIFNSAVKMISEKNLIESAVKLLITDHTPTRREIGRALATLASNPQTTTDFLSHDTLSTLLESLRIRDMDLYHSVAIAFGCIFSTPDVQDGKTDVVDQSKVLALLQKTNRQIQIAALWATSTGSESVIMKDSRVLRIVAALAEPQLPSPVEGTEEAAGCDADTPLQIAPTDENNEPYPESDPIFAEFIDRFGEKPVILKTIRRRALVTLANYAANPENHSILIDNCSNVIANTFNLIDCDDVEVFRMSALFLANIASSIASHPEFEELLAKHVDVTRLDLLVGHTDLQTRTHAVRALAHFVVTERFGRQMVLCERLIPLLCLSSLTAPIQLNQQIAACFRNLTVHQRFIPSILEQHAVPGLMQLLTLDDQEIIVNTTLALQNLSVHPETIERMVEYQHGCPILWDLLHLRGESRLQQGAVKLLAFIGTRESDAKEQLIGGLSAKLSQFSKQPELSAVNSKEEKDDEDDDRNEVKPEGPVVVEVDGDLLRKRLTGLSTFITETADAPQYMGGVLLRQLAALVPPEFHMGLVDSESVRACFSLIRSESTKNIEIGLSALGDLLKIPEAIDSLIDLDNDKGNKLDVVENLQKRINHEWISIRWLTTSVTCLILDHIEDKHGIHGHRGTFAHRFFHLPDARTSIQPNGLTIIKANAKIPDARLQSQTTRLFASFSNTRENLGDLVNDDMMNLFVFLADQAWGWEETELLVDEDQTYSGGEVTFIGQKRRSHEAVVAHLSIITCISNIVLNFGEQSFEIGSTALTPVIVRYLNDSSPQIRSLAFICFSGPNKNGVSTLFEIWEKPMEMCWKIFQDSNDVQCHHNIAKAFVNVTKHEENLRYILSETSDGQSGLDLLLTLSQAEDFQVASSALLAIHNLTKTMAWQQQTKHDVGALVTTMEELLFNHVGDHASHCQVPETAEFAEDMVTMLLSVLCDLSCVQKYQQALVDGVTKNQSRALIINTSATTCVKQLVRVIGDSSFSDLSLQMAVSTLNNLSQNNGCIMSLLDQNVLEASLFVVTETRDFRSENTQLKMSNIALSIISNLVTQAHENVLNGRDVRVQKQHNLMLSTSKHMGQERAKSSGKNPAGASPLPTLKSAKSTVNVDPTKDENYPMEFSFPFFDLPQLNHIYESLKLSEGKYSQSIRAKIAQIGARVTSQAAFNPTSIDLCFVNAVIDMLNGRDFHEQSFALTTLVNFIMKSNFHILGKIIESRNWIATLLCFVESPVSGIRAMCLRGVERIVTSCAEDSTPNHAAQTPQDSSNQNGAFFQSPVNVRRTLESKPVLVRRLELVFCDPNFPNMLRLTGNEVNVATLKSLANILRILSENLPIATLSKVQSTMLPGLIQLVLHDDWNIHFTASMALSCFLLDVESLQTVVESSHEGMQALFRMLESKVAHEQCQSIKRSSGTEAQTLGYLVMSALATITPTASFSRLFVEYGGLSLVVKQIFDGIAHPKYHQTLLSNQSTPTLFAAQILRNVCRDSRNMEEFLQQQGTDCLLRFIASPSPELKYLGAGALADMIYHATSVSQENKTLFSFTTEHLSPYMATITDCLLQLLVSPSDDASQFDVTGVTSPDMKSSLTGKNDRKLVRISLALLHRLCKDSDNCKSLISEAGAVQPLSRKWVESNAKKHPEADIILSLLKALSTFSKTQLQFVNEGGCDVLEGLVQSKTALSQNTAAVILNSLSRNKTVHRPLAARKVLPLLLELRHSDDADARRVALDILLTICENPEVHPIVREDVNLIQTIVAVSKFGANKNIKDRSAQVVIDVLGEDAYVDIAQPRHSSPQRARQNRSKSRTRSKIASHQKTRQVEQASPNQPRSKVHSSHSSKPAEVEDRKQMSHQNTTLQQNIVIEEKPIVATEEKPTDNEDPKPNQSSIAETTETAPAEETQEQKENEKEQTQQIEQETQNENEPKETAAVDAVVVPAVSQEEIAVQNDTAEEAMSIVVTENEVPNPPSMDVPPLKPLRPASAGTRDVLTVNDDSAALTTRSDSWLAKNSEGKLMDILNQEPEQAPKEENEHDA